MDAEKAIQKYDLNVSTFDVVKVNDFRNYKGSTLWWYFYMWILVILSLALLAVDIYSCLNILVFDKWGTQDYKPYAYSIAKWIFTGCIIFQFVLLLYHWIWAIHIYRTKNIALVYLNSICKRIYSIKSYNHFCLLNSIEEGKFFDICCFLTYYELNNAPQILIADAPRQVINILTLKYYATGGDLNADVLNNIKTIARTNLNLSVILSFMCLSVFIFAIFFFRFSFGILMYVPLKCSLRNEKHKTFKTYCSYLVNKSVSRAVRLHHKSKRELLDQGILSRERIAQLPELDQHPPNYKDYTRVYYTRTESEESIPMRSLNPRNISNTTIDLIPKRTESAPFLQNQPSFDHFQQSQQMYSTLNNDRAPIMNKRLSSLNERSRQNIYGKTNFAAASMSSLTMNQSNNDDSSNTWQNMPSTTNLINNENGDIYGFPKKPKRSYTSQSNWEVDTYNTDFPATNATQEDLSLSSTHSHIDNPTTNENPFRNISQHENSFTPESLQKASTEQFHIANSKIYPIQRSFTDTADVVTIQDTNIHNSIPLFEDESFEKPLNLEGHQTDNPPRSAATDNFDTILDAYKDDDEGEMENNSLISYPTQGQGQGQGQGVNDIILHSDSDSDDNINSATTPYPVRGVSKYFKTKE
ncbi:KCH1 [Candida oxycetoniae]|uniref:KCH1 n=1 Tax=Candida oxycetoniae TaxID=497107 RepID=A0AAI9SXV1_9ASCO|nr:KCH1 [Candida oxycetoniae]KAI3405084.2 KCH1 [Candida oxycetoniae]